MKEAALILTEEGFSALPVVDDDGRVVGVLSHADIVRYERERDDCTPHEAESTETPGISAALQESYGNGYHVIDPSSPPVSEVMTPVIVSVHPDAPCISIIRIMLNNSIHRVFVVDEDDTLLGVVSTLDVLQCLVS